MRILVRIITGVLLCFTAPSTAEIKSRQIRSSNWPLIFFDDFMISIICLCFLGFWVAVCFKNQQCFHRIHSLMGWLLVMIAVHLICVANDISHVKVTGIHQGWDVFFYNFQFFRVVLLFTVLIVTGWCLRKTNLQEWENQELDNHCWTMAISVRVMANVTYQVIEERFPLELGMNGYMFAVLMLLDIIWWVALLFPPCRSFDHGDDEGKLIICFYCLMYYVCPLLAVVDMWVKLANEI